MEKIGLALGGGAVLGAAHVGAIRAIEDLGIEISYLSGTSIGAFVASFYAFGKGWKEMQEIASKLKWLDITGVALTRYGLLSNQKLGELIIEHIGDKNIEDAEIPLAMVATDIATGEKVVLNKGSIAEAVMASTCIPGIYKPVEKDGRMLVDGGIIENVPIDTVRNMGATYTIGVDLNAKHIFKKPANILDVIVNSFHFLMKESVKSKVEQADLLIEPDLGSFNWTDTSQVEKLMEIGYKDSQNMLKRLT